MLAENRPEEPDTPFVFNIEPPLPLLAKQPHYSSRNEEAFGFLKRLPQFKVSLDQQQLNKINGPPVDENIYDEANLLDYLK
jgi:hypothetical protein